MIINEGSKVTFGKEPPQGLFLAGLVQRHETPKEKKQSRRSAWGEVIRADI